MNISTETFEFIAKYQAYPPAEVALLAGKSAGVDTQFAVAQIAGRQAIAHKVPSWHSVEGLIYPPHLSIEQCSSEKTARYKSSLLSGETLLDLTGGFGIDCAFLSQQFERITYVERQPHLCEIAAHNFPLLGLGHIAVKNGDGIEYLNEVDAVDCIYLDPARRDDRGGKTVRIEDCTPDIKASIALLLKKASRVMIKLSPMLDATMALKDIPQTKELHIVSVMNECKELLLIATRTPCPKQTIHCINITKDDTMETFVFDRETEQRAACTYTDKVETYLYEPNASILKAGAYKSIAAKYALRKLHPNSHLYTSTEQIASFPGRTFCVEASFPLNKKELKSNLAGIEKANLTVRNFPASVAELRKKLKLKEGGDVYLFATTLADERRVVVRGRRG